MVLFTIARETSAPDFKASSAAIRHSLQRVRIRFAVVGLAFAMVFAASARKARCFSSPRFLHSYAARAMPMGAAVNGPALCVTMSVMACATSLWVRQVTNSVMAGYTLRSRMRTCPPSNQATFSYCSMKARSLSALSIAPPSLLPCTQERPCPAPRRCTCHLPS